MYARVGLNPINCRSRFSAPTFLKARLYRFYFMMKSTISCTYIFFFRHRILVINLKSWRWAETGGCRTGSGMSTASLHTGHIHRGDPGHPQLSVERSSGLTGSTTFIRTNEWFAESIDRWLINSWLNHHDDNNIPNISLDDIPFQFHVDC